MKPSALAERRGLASGRPLRVPAALQAHGRGPAAPRRTCIAVRSLKKPEKAFKGFVARPSKSDMHLGNAWSLAKACQLAYKKKWDVKDTIEEWGLKGLKCFGYGHREGPDTQCFVAAGDDFIVVAFRGTMVEQLTDVKLDLQIALEKGPLDSDVHGGFLEGVEGVCENSRIIDSVMKAVRELQAKYGKSKPLAIYVTGHSLGAAESTLATAYMLEQDDLKDHVVGNYTFGSPRVGDVNFKKKFERATAARRKLTHRFQNRKDIVTYVPVWRPWWQYAHVGQWWYMHGDEQTLMRNPPLLTRLWDDFFGWGLREGVVYDHMLDHDDGPGGYINGLEKNFEPKEYAA